MPRLSPPNPRGKRNMSERNLALLTRSRGAMPRLLGLWAALQLHPTSNYKTLLNSRPTRNKGRSSAPAQE